MWCRENNDDVLCKDDGGLNTGTSSWVFLNTDVMTLSKCAHRILLISRQPIRVAKISSYLRHHVASCGRSKNILTSKPTRQHTLKCHASEPQGTAKDANSNNIYNIPPPVVVDDATRRRSDKWAAILAVVTILLWGYWRHVQIARWFSLSMHKLDIPGCLATIFAVAAVAVYCKDRVALFWGRQQRSLPSSRRLACIDVTPDLARDVSTLKQDLFDIKKDVKDIKIVLKDIKDRLAAKPWYRF